MTALISGAGGWFGRAMLRLVESGEVSLPDSTVVLLGPMDDTDLDTRWKKFATVRRGDLLDRVFIESLPLADLLIHAAACIHPRATLPSRKLKSHPKFVANSAMLTNLLSRLNPDSSTVLISSIAAASASPGYGRSKLDTEMVLANHSPSVRGVILRAAWFFGPGCPSRQRTFDKLARRGFFPMFGDGSSRRSVSYVDDVVHAALRAAPLASTPSPVLPVASEGDYTLAQVLSARLVSSRPRFSFPLWLHRLCVLADRSLQSRGGYLAPLKVLAELGSPLAFDPSSVSAARRLLGLSPSLPLTSGVWLERLDDSAHS